MSTQFVTSASEESEAGSHADAFWQSLLRFPSKRPQKGVQCLRDVNGEEVWAGSDDDFHRAVAVSPGAFTWKRLVRNLVELPALWFRLPLQGREGAELWTQARAVLEQHKTPLPHFVVAGDDALTLLWRIDPLRRPKESAPEFHHRCFNEQLQYWRWAVIKLSFAFEDLGARPLDMATADELLTSLVPLPMPSSSVLLAHAAELGLEPTTVLHVAGDAVGDVGALRIAAVSKPLTSFNTRLFTAIGRTLPTQKKVWRATEVSQEARKPKGAGERHPAAVKLVCANRWDGLSAEDNVRDLQAWAATCDRDSFPARGGGGGDELSDLVAWAEKTLEVGGPTEHAGAKSPKRRQRTSRDHVAAAVLGFLADEAGAWSGSVAELGKRAALWALDRGLQQAMPLRTLKRALVDLLELSELTQSVVRAGSTWLSQWSLRAPALGPAAAPPPSPLALLNSADLAPAEAGLPQGHQGKSMWAPGLAEDSFALTSRGGEGGGFPPQGGPGGDSPSPSSTFPGPLEPADPRPDHLASSTSPPPEFDLSEVDLAEAPEAHVPETDLTGPARPPRQRRLSLPRDRGGRSRQARVPGVGLPTIDAVLQNALADVGCGLNDADHKALLEEARSGLVARPRVLDDFADALRRRANRILRLREFAAASAEHVAARKKAEARRVVEAAEPLMIDERPPEVALDAFRQLLAAQVKPLHERTVIERARRLYADGLSLIPLEPSSKEPALPSWKAQQSERLSLGRLEKELNRLGPDAGLAVICGDVSEVVVADFDDLQGVAWAREHLPDTPWKTRTSRGEHWYFRLYRETWTAPTTPLPWKGELRARGHYVVAPGSLHPDGHRYQAIGTWSASLQQLPVWNHRWLEATRGEDELRRLRVARARILKGDP